MSPDGQNINGKITIPDNLYTVLLALAVGSVMVTVALVAYKCFVQYGTIFTISS
jgi:hypothetical protein